MVPNSGLRGDSQSRGSHCRLGGYSRGRNGPGLFIRSIGFPPPMKLLKQRRDQDQLYGTLDLGDLARFQYFHTFRRTWPVAVVAVLILTLVMPLSTLAIIANPDSDLRPIFTNALPFALLLVLLLFLLGPMPS